MVGWEAVSVAVMAVISIISIIVSIIFFENLKAYFPLKTRSRTLFYVHMSCFFAFNLVTMLFYLEIYPCNAYIWSLQLIFEIYSINLLADAYRSFFNFRLNRDLANFEMDTDQSDADSTAEMVKSSFLLRNRKYLIDRNYLLIVLFFGFLHMVYVFTLTAIFDSDQWSNTSTDPITAKACEFKSFQAMIIGLYLFVAILAITSVILFRRYLAGFVDGLGIVRDLRTILIVWSIAVLAQLVLGAILPDKRIYRVYCNLFGLFMACWLTYGINYYHAYQTKIHYLNIPEQESESVSLKTVLNTNQLRAAFKKFLESEWSVENLLFYMDVNLWHQKKLWKNISEFHRMIAKYFSDDSPFELNVPFAVRAKILEEAKTIEADPNLLKDKVNVFDACRDSIYDSMESDAFLRFKKSRFWTNLSWKNSKSGSIVGSRRSSMSRKASRSSIELEQTNERASPENV